MKSWIDVELEKIRIATEEARKEDEIRQVEIQTSEFNIIKLVDIDAKIDAIQNLSQLEILLKKFVRFVIART